MGTCLFLLSKHQTWKTFLLVILIYFLCSGLQQQRCNHGGTEASLFESAHTLHENTRACTHTSWALPVKAATLFINTVWWGMQLNIPFWLLRGGAVIRGSLNIPPCLTCLRQTGGAKTLNATQSSLDASHTLLSCKPNNTQSWSNLLTDHLRDYMARSIYWRAPM